MSRTIFSTLVVLMIVLSTVSFGDGAGQFDANQTASRSSDSVDASGDEGCALGCALSASFAFICALWAQNTDRNALLWFIMGALFSVITGLVMLDKNANDREEKRFQDQESP